MRTITANGRAIPLGIYIKGIKKAISLPDTTFPHGLTCWWSTTGKEIREQFLESIHDRINQGIPYFQRGVTQ
jgi:hypothetical protein